MYHLFQWSTSLLYQYECPLPVLQLGQKHATRAHVGHQRDRTLDYLVNYNRRKRKTRHTGSESISLMSTDVHFSGEESTCNGNLGSTEWEKVPFQSCDHEQRLKMSGEKDLFRHSREGEWDLEKRSSIPLVVQTMIHVHLEHSSEGIGLSNVMK